MSNRKIPTVIGRSEPQLKLVEKTEFKVFIGDVHAGTIRKEAVQGCAAVIGYCYYPKNSSARGGYYATLERCKNSLLAA